MKAGQNNVRLTPNVGKTNAQHMARMPSKLLSHFNGGLYDVFSLFLQWDNDFSSVQTQLCYNLYKAERNLLATKQNK